MTLRTRVLHSVELRELRGVRVVVLEETRSTIRATYTAYHYYIVCRDRRTKISRQAAVLLGVKV